LSHWHRDHSGGMLRAIDLIKAKREPMKKDIPLIVDLHPARPAFRGFQGPQNIISLEADPTFQEIKDAGAEVLKNDSSHLVLDGFFMISGEIPRNSTHEVGLRRGMRYNEGSASWEEDTEIKDERYVLCNVKGKGLVVFTGCSHAGIINIAKNAVASHTAPLFALMGGFHLADADEIVMNTTVTELKSLDPKILLPGHCTGWRAKYKIEEALPGQLAPSTVGMRYEIKS